MADHHDTADEKASQATSLKAGSDGASLETDGPLNPEILPVLATELAEEIDRVKQERKEKKKAKKKKDKDDKDKGLGSSRGIETMFRTTYRVHMDLTSLADTKANIMISINGLIMSILIASIAPKLDANTWLLYPTVVFLIGCLTSMVFAILSARPRVSSQYVTLEDVRSNRKNILFFGNFGNMSERDFETGMIELMKNTDGLYTNMIRDVYGLGRVLVRKFTLLRISYTVFMVGLIVGVIMFILVFIFLTPDATVPLSFPLAPDPAGMPAQ